MRRWAQMDRSRFILRGGLALTLAACTSDEGPEPKIPITDSHFLPQP